jgi:hypothetical protein
MPRGRYNNYGTYYNRNYDRGPYRKAVPIEKSGRKLFSARETNEFAIIKFIIVAAILLLSWFFVALSVHLSVDADDPSGDMSTNAKWITVAICIGVTMLVFALDMAVGHKLVPLFFKK